MRAPTQQEMAKLYQADLAFDEALTRAVRGEYQRHAGLSDAAREAEERESEVKFNWSPEVKSPTLTTDTPEIAAGLALARRFGAEVTFDPADLPDSPRQLKQAIEQMSADPQARELALTRASAMSDAVGRVVFMHPLDTYASPQRALDTLLHELAHTAGPALGRPQADAVPVVIVEEIVAELASAQLQHALGFEPDLSYVAMYVTAYLWSAPGHLTEVLLASAVVMARVTTELLLGHVRVPEARPANIATMHVMAELMNAAYDAQEAAAAPTDQVPPVTVRPLPPLPKRPAVHS